MVSITLASALCSACGGEEENPHQPAAQPSQPASDAGAEASVIEPQPPNAKQPDESVKPSEESAKGPPQGRSIDDIPWPARPGVRIATLRANVPMIDRVVLVPDEATYLEALSEWSLSGRWPVLFEDDEYAPMFIRRYKPAEVIRKAATTNKLPRNEALEEAMQRVVCRAWGTGEDLGQADEATAPSTRECFEEAGWKPPGVVITSAKDAAWPAALALAADRGEPLAFLDERFGPVNGSVSAEDWPRLDAQVTALVAATGYPYDQLGDAIDTITIVRELPAKYVTPDDPAGNSRNAVTDGLARRADKTCWGFAGWIFGPAPRATYMAMCSIFLQPESALLFDTYQPTPGWSRYAMGKPAASLEEAGLEVEQVASPASSAAAWGNLAPSGVNADLVLVNTKGNQNWFSAADEKRVYVHDVPILNAPAMVHFIHSWSCIAPENRNTLAGRWLERGAYAYVGSVHEPSLGGFVPPEVLVERLRASVPYLIAARVWGTVAWRIATIGDPLMTILRPVPRAAPDTRPITGEDLRDVLKRQTPLAEQSGDWSQALRTINLLGLDEVAMALYRQRLNDNAPADTMALALGAVFRNGDEQTFLHAIEQIPISQVTPLQRDMLWLKWLPTLRTLNDPAQIDLMRALIRTPLGFVDACRLAPVMRSRGQGELVGPMLDENEKDASDGYARQLIRTQRR